MVRLIFLNILLALNVSAEDIFGNPGDILPIKSHSSNEFLSIKKNDNFYRLVPLPFDKQGKSIIIENKTITINYKDFGESRITIVDESMVTLSKQDSERVYAESISIKDALGTFTTEFKPSMEFINPVEGVISSRYGKKRFINNKPRSPHLSLDIAAPEGTEIVAPENGKIILSGNFFYSGNYLLIDHGFGLLSSYSHLSSINVENNAVVKKGEKIGEVGSTGRVTGPHLHWTVYLDKVKINPELLLKQDFLNRAL